MTSGRFPRFLDVFTKHRTIGPLERLSGYIRSLPPGDRVIASILGVLVVSISIVATGALLRSFMVVVPTYGGSVTEGSIGTPRFVNPLLALSDADRDMTALTFAGLMGLSGDGSIVPVLAETYSVSDDGKVYTFVLKHGVKFSDGTAVTAEDVVFTVEKAQDPALKSPEYANWANIRAEVVDARTVRFTLPKPYAPFLADTTLGILPSHLWRNVGNDKFAFSPLMQHPVGAGPFRVTKVVEDKDGAITEYQLAYNPYFALGRPYLNTMRVKFYADHTALQAAYKSGKVQNAYSVMTPHSLRAPYARVFGVFFNKKQNPALGDLAMRKALSVAIDREHIVEDIQGGAATAVMGPVPPGTGIVGPAIPDTATRIESAKQILADGGWTYDETAGTWKNAKAKLSLDTVVIRTSTVPELRSVVSSVQTDWQAIGVPVSVELYEPGVLTKDVIRPRAYQALLFGMVVGRGQDLYAFWDSSEQADPGLNIASYANKSVDTLLEKARTERDPQKAAALIQDASDKIALEYPAAFTHAPEFLYAISNTLYGVSLPQIAAPADRFATVATWYRERAYVWPFLATSH